MPARGRRPQDEAPCDVKIFPPVLKAEGLTKRYGSRQALTDCHPHVPQGRVIGLVDPKGTSVPAAHSETTAREALR
jgi:hypothetical protein